MGKSLLGQRSLIYVNGEAFNQNHMMYAFSNSAFWWGDSVFSTIGLFEKDLYFWDDHWERLEKGVYGQFQSLPDMNEIKERTLRILKNQAQKGLLQRARITINLDEEGLFFWVLALSPFESDNSFVDVKTILDVQNCPSRDTNLKLGAYGDRLRKKRELGLKMNQELLFISKEDEVLESLFSNICFIKENELCLLPEKKGVLAGITIKHFESCLKSFKVSYSKRPLFLNDLKKVRGGYLTSSIKGLRKLGSLDGRSFDKGMYSEDLMSYWTEYKNQHRLQV